MILLKSSFYQVVKMKIINFLLHAKAQYEHRSGSQADAVAYMKICL